MSGLVTDSLIAQLIFFAQVTVYQTRRDMSAARRKKQIAYWEHEGPRRHKFRTSRYIFHIEPPDLEEYNQIMLEARLNFQAP